MGEFDETPVSEPIADEPAAIPAVSDTTEMPAVGEPAPAFEEPAAPAGAPEEALAADVADADESGAELIARLAAELSDEPAEETAVEAESGSVQEQLALDVPLVEAAPEVAPESAPDAAADAAAQAGAAKMGAAGYAAYVAAEAAEAAEAVHAAEGAPAAAGSDDLETAIAAAKEQIAEETTLDDIAPGTKHAEEDEADLEAAAPKFGAPWWPFLVYLAAWLAFVGYGAWQLAHLPAGQVAYQTQPYTLFLFGGVIMAAVGPVLVLAVWIAGTFSASRQNTGLFSSAFIKGAVVTLVGVVVWWGSFMAVDFLRLGRTF